MALVTYAANRQYNPSYAGATCRWKALTSGDIVEPGALIQYESTVGVFLLLTFKRLIVGKKLDPSETTCVVLANQVGGSRIWDRVGEAVGFGLTSGTAYVLLPS